MIGLGAGLLCPPLATVAAAHGASLGILPFLSREELVRRYAPLCAELETSLGPVGLYSAPDLRTFLSRLEAGVWDLALAPPHFVQRAVTRGGYIPVWRIDCSAAIVLVARAESGISSLEALPGRTLGLPDPLSLTTLLAQRFLKTSGLAETVRLTHVPRYSALLERLTRGLSDAVFLPQSLIDGTQLAAPCVILRVIPSPVALGPVFLAHSRNARALVALEALAAKVRAEPERWAGLFPGRSRRLLPAVPDEFAAAAAFLATAPAGAPS